MPWTIADVDGKKKGLTEKQKRQWVRVANSALATCKKKGGKDCEAMAIKQANGVVGNSSMYAVYKISQDSGDYEVEIKTHQKRKHLVVPVTMMVEGVHNGSAGPLLHTMDELGKYPESWNGIPVVIYHPQEDGVNISANSPDVIDRECVGRVYGTYVSGNKLKANIWLVEEDLKRVDEDTLEAINNKQAIEVSVGVFTDEEEVIGDWNGETYEAIAKNHRPDHLALLPGEIGACSIEDGCGVRVNKKGGNNVLEVNEMIEKLSESGYSINRIGDHTKQGYQEMMRKVNEKLRTLDSETGYTYLEEMYNGYLIYSKNDKDGSKMYKQNYEMKDGNIDFVGNSVEVTREVKFVEIKSPTGFVRTKFNTNKKEENKMSDDAKCTDCVKKKVDALIANSNGVYTEADRAELETLSETTLDRMAKPIVKEVIKEVEKKVEVNTLTDQQKAAIAYGERLLKEKREGLIKGIQDNTKEYSVEELNTMSDTMLEKLEKVIKANVKKEEEVVDYSGQGPVTFGRGGVVGDDEPLYPAGIEIEKTKK